MSFLRTYVSVRLGLAHIALAVMLVAIFVALPLFLVIRVFVDGSLTPSERAASVAVGLALLGLDALVYYFAGRPPDPDGASVHSHFRVRGLAADGGDSLSEHLVETHTIPENKLPFLPLERLDAHQKAHLPISRNERKARRMARE